MMELSSSNIRDFKLTICEGRIVVRSQSRIIGLLGVRENRIPEQYLGLLAIPIFYGSGANEEIIWTTDRFTSSPARLSELSDDKQKYYRIILDSALQSYADAIVDAQEDVKRLLYAAITYISDSSIFCGDDRVVITEWGVTPLTGREVIGMPIGIENEQIDPDEKESDKNVGKADYEEPDNQSLESSRNNDNDDNPSIPDKNAKSEMTEYGNKHSGDRKKRKVLYYIIAALIIAAVTIVCILVNSCSSPMKTVLPTTPELNPEDISLSKDSVNYIVSNRLILMVTAEDTSLESFVGEFRKDYPDQSRYLLSSPDSLLRRITLTLPENERETLEQELPVKYNRFGLLVIPEAMYKTSSTVTNDPDLQVQDKRWYFDECGVFDAWDVTMGDPDIIIAIIDDGFDLEHPELQGRAYKPFNAVNHTSNITPSPGGHGTHVASTAIGNADNGTGIAGIAPKCRFMPIQVGDNSGNMSSSAIIDGVLYAIANGADVVNMSLGMYFGPNVQYMPPYLQNNIRNFYFKQEEQMWNQIFNMARQNDVTFILAGGNENILIGIDPMSRSNATIKVSAIGEGRSKASFSNYGDLSTVSAPGVHIYNAVPGNAYTFMDGTSMAAPIVTGGCALLKSYDKSLSTSEMANILRATGNTSIGPVGPTVNFANALQQKDDEEIIIEAPTCSDINRRYAELLVELEQLRREHSGCILQPDTMAIPVNVTLDNLKGRWKSTTAIQNSSNEQVVIYFTFNGTNKGRLDVVEPSGRQYTATLNLKINHDIIYIDQEAPATSSSYSGGYNPYKFIIRPNRQRNAEGKANSKVEAYNAFNFSLVRI